MWTAALLAFALPVFAQQTAWGQCGGSLWSGATTCISGHSCVVINSYYSQCQPGGPATTVTTPVTTVSSPTRPTSTATGTTSGGAVPTGGSGSGPGTTLQKGYYWIRAVAAPNFHKYLQTNPQYSTGIALLETYTKAGQFQVVNGQLVELVDNSGTLLYLNVAQPVADEKKLAVTFSKTPNTYGTFDFSGDTLTWSATGLSRPNNAAWLVCANQQLFINLGPYAYQTPAGCSDQTIHYYNDSKANE